mmetsp:Transcript_5545/g.15905  ORF Transcript_5545/g.15905 Transcript_5545/m.15905 type:complete len:365 (+) Transcript_5545:567-1661(+)
MSPAAGRPVLAAAAHTVGSVARARTCKVLFCTRHFPWSANFTRDIFAQDSSVEVMQCDATEVATHIGAAHVAVPFMARLDDATLAHARHLKLIIQYGVGVEGIDIPSATRRGIWVSNIKSSGTGNAVSCAEHIIHLTLSLLRNTRGMQQSISDRLIGTPLGQTLFGKRVLVVGLGNITAELLPRLAPFGAHVVVVRSREPGRGGLAPLPPDVEPLVAEYGAGRKELLRLLPTADIVVLACTQSAETKGLVDKAFLHACKRGVFIVNVARGGLLDYDAVSDGLAKGCIGGLGLDVAWEEPLEPDDPLWSDPRVIATPHVAGVTEVSYRNMATILAEEVRRVQQGLPPTIQVNQPTVLNGVREDAE